MPRLISASGGCMFTTSAEPGQPIGPEPRADAKRVASGLSKFSRAELNFDGVTDIGHGFADELFRVFQREHPEVELVPMAMQPRVAQMVAAVVQ